VTGSECVEREAGKNPKRRQTQPTNVRANRYEIPEDRQRISGQQTGPGTQAAIRKGRVQTVRGQDELGGGLFLLSSVSGLCGEVLLYVSWTARGRPNPLDYLARAGVAWPLHVDHQSQYQGDDPVEQNPA
jgi:hypothetical protein